MDEISHLDHNWEVKIIPNEDFVLRQVHILRTKDINGKKIPTEAAFSLRSSDLEGLSVNWERYITIKENYILLGLTFNSNKKFVDYTLFKIFKIQVQFIRSLENIEDVVHSPVFHGSLPPIGRPNNYAHSLIQGEIDEEVRMGLADYCMNNYEDSYCKYQVATLNTEINSLRQRLDEQVSG